MRRSSATKRPRVRAAWGRRFGPRTTSAMMPDEKQLLRAEIQHRAECSGGGPLMGARRWPSGRSRAGRRPVRIATPERPSLSDVILKSGRHGQTGARRVTASGISQSEHGPAAVTATIRRAPEPAEGTIRQTHHASNDGAQAEVYTRTGCRGSTSHQMLTVAIGLLLHGRDACIFWRASIRPGAAHMRRRRPVRPPWSGGAAPHSPVCRSVRPPGRPGRAPENTLEAFARALELAPRAWRATPGSPPTGSGARP